MHGSVASSRLAWAFSIPSEIAFARRIVDSYLKLMTDNGGQAAPPRPFVVNVSPDGEKLDAESRSFTGGGDSDCALGGRKRRRRSHRRFAGAGRASCWARTLSRSPSPFC